MIQNQPTATCPVKSVDMNTPDAPALTHFHLLDECQDDAGPVFRNTEADMEYWAYEYAYKDGRINVSALVNDVEIPTIGLFNGPGFHSEIVLMCDITLAADDATIFDLHYDIGSVPADGIHNCFQELLGVKRAAYALLTGQAITAEQALEWGMVNEVVPHEQLMESVRALARRIALVPEPSVRLNKAIAMQGIQAAHQQHLQHVVEALRVRAGHGDQRHRLLQLR